MGKLIRVLAVLVVLSVVASYAGAVTIKPGTYQLKWLVPPSDGNVYQQATMNLSKVTAAEKARFVGLPPGEVYWGAQGGFGVVLARKTPSDKQFNLAYLLTSVPASGKLDLKHAARIPLEQGEWGNGDGPDYPYLCPGLNDKPAQADWVMGEGDDRVVKKIQAGVSVEFEPDDKGIIRPARASVETRGAWFGTVDTDEGKLDVQTIDSNDDRTYNDVRGIGKTHDAIELSNVGEEPDWLLDYGMMYLGQASSHDGKLYALNVSSAGDKLEIKPYTGPTGSVKLEVVNAEGKPADEFEVYLAGDRGRYVFGSEDIVLPPGEYRVTVLIMDGVDEFESADDYYYGVYATSRTALKVEQDKTIGLRIGGGMQLAIEPGKEIIEAKPGSKAEIRLEFSMNGDKSIIRGSKMPRAEVTDSSGKVVHRGAVRCAYDSEAPVHALQVSDSWKPGDYTLTVTLNAKPYQEKVTASKTLRITK